MTQTATVAAYVLACTGAICAAVRHIARHDPALQSKLPEGDDGADESGPVHGTETKPAAVSD